MTGASAHSTPTRKSCPMPKVWASSWARVSQSNSPATRAMPLCFELQVADPAAVMLIRLVLNHLRSGGTVVRQEVEQTHRARLGGVELPEPLAGVDDGRILFGLQEQAGMQAVGGRRRGVADGRGEEQESECQLLHFSKSLETLQTSTAAGWTGARLGTVESPSGNTYPDSPSMSRDLSCPSNISCRSMLFVYAIRFCRIPLGHPGRSPGCPWGTRHLCVAIPRIRNWRMQSYSGVWQVAEEACGCRCDGGPGKAQGRVVGPNAARPASASAPRPGTAGGSHGPGRGRYALLTAGVPVDLAGAGPLELVHRVGARRVAESPEATRCRIASVEVVT